MRDEHLYAFLADTRARSAAGVRRRTRWLRQQLRADTSFDDLCRDLASSATPVELSLANGRHCRGRLTAVGGDVLALRQAEAATAYVTKRAVIGVRALGTDRQTGAGGTPGAPALRDTHLFIDVLADLADHRDRVVVATVVPRTYKGIIGGVARDFMWFDDNRLHLRVEAITDVLLEVAS